MIDPVTEPSSIRNRVSPESVATQWAAVRSRVSEACKKSGRSEKDVTVVGVTKYVDAATSQWLVDAGCRDLGESRPQSLWEKQAALVSPNLLANEKINWHFIGHLQRNKSLKTISNLTMLHSLDSIRLAQQVDRDAESLGIRVRALVEVNISGETNKTGILLQELPDMLESIASLKRIQLCGLMGMAGLQTPNPRTDFVKLRELRDQTLVRFGSQFEMNHLSMGMSGDFEAAIEEGSSIVRIGSLLFESTGS